MTREEAIKALERADNYVGIHYINGVEDPYINPHLKEAIKVALSALRPVSREQVEKAWRGCPECKPKCGLCVNMEGWDRHGKPYVCEQCVDYSNFESDQRFCEVCGRPLTDEAVEMVMERMEKLHEDNGCS